MTDGIRHGDSSTGDPAELLPMAFAQPHRAVAGARALLAGEPSDHAASIACQVLGLVERDFGDLDSAIGHLRRAVRLARRGGSATRLGDTMASLGLALIHRGRTRSGLDTLRAATHLGGGHAGAQVRFRLAGALWMLDRPDEAHQELGRAIPALRRAGDTVWVARALTLRALLHLAAGAANRADRDFGSAEQLFARTEQDHDRAVAVHNRGLVALRAGDLPTALAQLDDAGSRYRVLGTPMPEHDIDHCTALLTAGLNTEALAYADRAIARLAAQHGQPTRRAELLLTAARAALAAGEPATAGARAGAACRLFAAQRRDRWHARGRLLVLQSQLAGARAGAGAGAGLAREAARCATRLASWGATEAVPAYLLAGRAALAAGWPDRAEPLLAIAARARHAGPALSRVQGWLAQALRAQAAGSARRTLAACRHGLAVLHGHNLTLGASELRAQATGHGAELAELATRTCLHAGTPRQLLVWSERWRATALSVLSVRPPPDRVLQADLTRYRDLIGRASNGPALGHRQRRLEQAIQARVRQQPGGAADEGGHRPLAVPELLAGLGDGQLVEILEVDRSLQVLLCGNGRVRRFPAGRAGEVAAEVGFTRAALHRLARRAATDPEQAVAALAAAGRRLEELLLGTAVRHLRDGPMVVVPPGRLYAVPWALLPSLRDRAVSVAPSARTWLRAGSASRPPAGDVLVVHGPGLAAAAAEVSAVAGMYRRATVLDGAAATADAVLAALDGRALVHLAAHGTFRADSPLFSALQLADGPLTVHDLDRLRRAPYRLVLPSCESARLAPAGADELLGLASALLPLGTAGLVASVVPVNDDATAPLMLALHRGLRDGQTMARALADARASTGDDPVAQATGWSFQAIGAA